MSNYDRKIRDEVEKKILATCINYSFTEEVREVVINKVIVPEYFSNSFYVEVLTSMIFIYHKNQIPTVENISLNRSDMYRESLVEGVSEQETFLNFKMDLLFLAGNHVPFGEFQTNVLILKEFVIMEFWNNTASNILNSFWHNRDVFDVSDNIIFNYNTLLQKLTVSKSKDNQDVNGSVDSIIERALKKHERFKLGIDTSIKTGHHGIDNHMGGFAENELIIIGGRPGMGKTALALAICKFNSMDHRKEMKKGLFFTLEMTKEQLMMKYASPHLGIPYSLLKEYKINDADFQRLMDYFRYLETTIPVQFIFENRLEEIVRLSLELKPDYIIIDYLQLVKTISKHQSREQEVAFVSKSLKELSVQCGCPVIALSQLKRKDNDSAPPKLTDLRESGSLEQDADTVIFPHRPAYNNHTAPDYEQGNTDFHIPKCRSSGPGVFYGFFDIISYNISPERVHTFDDYKRITGRT